MNYKTWLGIFCILFSSVLSAGSDNVIIRHAGKKLEFSLEQLSPAWKKADIVSGFTIPGRYSIETFRSEGAMLFDDEHLHILLTAYKRDFFKAPQRKRSLSEDNNFEVFLFTDFVRGIYYQLRISQSGEFYLARSEGNLSGAAGRRSKYEIPGIRHLVKTSPRCWQALISIPLSSLFPADKGTVESRKILFNICRQNIDIPGKTPEASSFAVLDRMNYHQSFTWRTAELRREDAGDSRIHISRSAGARINLIPNGDFNLILNRRLPGWYFINPRDVEHRETSEFSGSWVMRGSNRAYQLFTAETPYLQEGRDYTLRIRARQFGGGNSIGVLPMLRRPDGQVVQGKRSIVWKLPLTDEFREYVFYFTAEKNQRYLSFYRMGEKIPSSGADYDSVELFEGKLPVFEIRKIARIGNKSIIPGTEIRPAANEFGRPRGGMKILAVCEDQMAFQAPYEIFSGMGVTVDSLTTTGRGADLYYTDHDPDVIHRRLKDGEYDLYFTGRNLYRIGKGLAGLMTGNIQKGAGLVTASAGDYGLFGPLFQQEKIASEELQGTFAGKGGIFSFFRPRRMKDVAVQFRKIGKGRVISYATGNTPLPDFIEEYNCDNIFPYEKFTHAWVARICCFAAGKLSPCMESLRIQGKQAEIRMAGRLPEGAILQYAVYGKDGSRQDCGTVKMTGNQAALSLQSGLNGRNLLVVKMLDQEGFTLDYGMVDFHQEGPVILKLTDLEKYHAGQSAAHIRYRLSEVKPAMHLTWNLRDFAGRILEQGASSAAKEGSIRVPLSALYTNYSRFTLNLLINGRKSDVSSIPVFVQDRDRKRLLSDFTPCVWPPEPYVSKTTVHALSRQLENIGIRSLGFLYGDSTRLLSEGLGSASGMSVGGGNQRFYIRKQKSHIRHPEIHSVQARREIVSQTEKAVSAGRFMGAVSCSLCDEPGLCRKDEADELDAHPDNLAEYRRRMEKQFGTIVRFNEVCGTSYRSFAELQPGLIAEARKTGRFAEFILWRNFNTDRWCEVLKLMSDTARKIDPEIRLSIPNTFGQGALGGNDYWRLLTRSGLGFSQEYTSMVYMGGMENSSPIYDFDEFYRSFAPGMRVWGYIGYINSEARLRFQPWWFAAHQYGGFTWFAAYSPLIRSYGLGTAWNLVDIPGNSMTVDAQNLKNSLESSGLLKGTGRILLDYSWAERETAVYYSHDSMLVSFCLGKEKKEGEIDRRSGPLHDYFYSRHALRYLLEGMLYQYDFVAPDQIMQGGLSRYKVLFMPGIRALSDGEIAALTRFLEGGGRIICDFAPGDYDQLGRKRGKNILAQSGRMEILGRCFREDDGAAAETIRKSLEAAGVGRVMDSSVRQYRAGREGMHLTDGLNHLFLILRNPVRARGSIGETLAFPAGGHIHDILQGRYLGRKNAVPVHLNDKMPAAFFSVSPYRTADLKITMPEKIRAGSDLTAQIRIVTEKGNKAGRHVFHLEVIPPGTAQVRPHMMRNMTAEAGKADFVFRMGFNDPRGSWTLLVKDVLSGMTGKKTFILE